MVFLVIQTIKQSKKKKRKLKTKDENERNDFK